MVTVLKTISLVKNFLFKIPDDELIWTEALHLDPSYRLIQMIEWYEMDEIRKLRWT